MEKVKKWNREKAPEILDELSDVMNEIADIIYELSEKRKRAGELLADLPMNGNTRELLSRLGKIDAVPYFDDADTILSDIEEELYDED